MADSLGKFELLKPTRIRKRNRLIFNDDEDTSFSLGRSSPRKNPRVSSPASSSASVAASSTSATLPPSPPPPSPSPPPPPVSPPSISPPPISPPLPLSPINDNSTMASSPNYGPAAPPMKLTAQSINIRLRNILKLPKAHKWVCYEWFYSNLDQPLFLGDNEFCSCLRESFPQLKTRRLCRVEWCRIRRLMGKPRRCSPAFLAEEIASLHSKRQKIRLLQQRKAVDIASFRDLPEDIPLSLVIGTKVTARLRKPQDGLFMGAIDAVDTTDATYRITLDRQGLGTYSIPDYEVLTNDPQDMMPISAFAQKHRPQRHNYYPPPRFLTGSPNSQLDNDPLLSGTRTGLPPEEGYLGGFPVKFLKLLVRLSKILSAKREKLDQLKEMNTDAEKMRSYQIPITLDFQKKYASTVLEFEVLNKDLKDYLVGVQQYCQEIGPEQGLQPVAQPDLVRQRALVEAREMVEEQVIHNYPLVRNQRILELVAQLTSVMVQVKCLSENELNSFEFKSLSDTLAEIQSKLEPQNVTVFQNQVEIHVKHVEAGLSQMGNLHAFAANVPV